MEVHIPSTRSIRIRPKTSEKNKRHRLIVSEDVKGLTKPCKKNLMITRSAVAGAESKAEGVKKWAAMSKQKGWSALLSAKASFFLSL